MNILKRLSAKSQIALGQSGIIVSLLLTAVVIGLIPDRVSAVRDGRAMLAEALAANSSTFVTYADLRRIESNLQLVVQRNADLLSAGLRREDDSLAVSVAEHESHWEAIPGEYSTDTQLRVPIHTGDERWGQVELRFTSMQAQGLIGAMQTPWVQLTLFLGMLSFILFYLYLGRMLTQLDPSQAVPGRVRSALDTMAEGLLVLDRKEQIVLANHAFATLLGKTTDQLTGARASQLPWVTSDGAATEDAERPWIRAVKQGVAQTNQMIRLKLDGQPQRTFMINCSPVLGSKGNYAGVLVSFDDITLLEEKEVELRKSRAEAVAANEAKSSFLANMSHEIRTPMNAVLGFTEILQRGYSKNPQDSHKYLNTIHSSGKHLLDLINDILDLSKVESGRMEIERMRCAPHQVIAEIVNVLSVKANEKGLSLEFCPEGDLPETILSDPSRLRQIITNLVGNAIKFTEQGGVTVKLKLSKSSVEPQLTIDIVDTGIGMQEEGLENIFNPFVQADTSVTRRFGGTGLGLSISKRFTEALGGDITVTSRPGMGSTFSVRIDTGSLDGIALLPATELMRCVEDQRQEEAVRWVFPPSRVLVVDDGVENRELVKLVLEENNINVAEAENGQIGVEKALAAPYDVILMDIQMPVMDGFMATQALREANLQTPIIARTANAMKGFEQKCLDAGYTGYMTKPIDIDQLVAKLAELLNATVAEASPEKRVPTLFNPANDEAGDSGATAPIYSRLSTSDPRFHRLISRFTERLAAQLKAIDIAWTERNYAEIADLAHWLKGAGGTVGFDIFTSPAHDLEQFAKFEQEGQIEATLAIIHDLSRRLSVDESMNGSAAAADSVATTVEDVVPPSAEKEAPPEHTADTLVSRFADDPRLRPIIEKFRLRLDRQLALMRQQQTKGNLEELADLAHWLKGAGGTIGFDEFNEPAAQLEKLAKESNLNAITPLLDELDRLAQRIVPAAPSLNESDDVPAARQKGQTQ
ncbi:MAG: ATP-binding protein [Pseudomonadales bacterium]